MLLRWQDISAQNEASSKKESDTVLMSDALANAAKLLAELARAAMLVELMGARAVPAGELAIAAHLSPQTASEHLARLTEAGFVTARRQGRHRYYELSNKEVAYAVESLMILSSMYKRFSELGWIERLRTSRAVRVTLEGRQGLSKHLHMLVG